MVHERSVVRLPRGCASRFPGRWAVVLALRTRRKINTRLWVCLRGDVLQVLPAGSGVRNLDVFHDREGFTTVWSSKSFAIMKIRSGVRIAAADRGSRAGYARPGIAEPRPGPGISGFPQATTARTTSDRAVSRTGVYCKTRPWVRPGGG